MQNINNQNELKNLDVKQDVNTESGFKIVQENYDEIMTFNKTKRYIKLLMPINSVIEGKIYIAGTLTNVKLRIIDFIGQEDNVLLYKVANPTNSLINEGYLLSKFKPNGRDTTNNTASMEYFFSPAMTMDTSFGLKFSLGSVFLPRKATNVLILGGPSGAGKTYLEKYLVNERSDRFNKLHQITTRSSRGEDDPYLFSSKEMYNKIEPLLIGKVKGENKYGNFYGSLPIFDESKINTIILSEEGYNDFKNYWLDNKDVIVFTAYIGTDSLDTLEKRTNRDLDVINQEIKLENMFMLDVYRDIEKNNESLPKIADLLVNAFNRYERI